MDAARALERRADAAERVGSSSVYKQANTRLNISICCPVIAGAAQFCPLLLKPALLTKARPARAVTDLREGAVMPRRDSTPHSARPPGPPAHWQAHRQASSYYC